MSDLTGHCRNIIQHPATLAGMIGVVWALACSGSAQHSIDARPVTGLPISAIDLVDAYVANEVAADQRFKDRYLEVSGDVDAIGKDIAETPYLILHGRLESARSVQASFSKADADRLAKVEKGQWVTVTCRCRGLLMHVQLDQCHLH